MVFAKELIELESRKIHMEPMVMGKKLGLKSTAWSRRKK